MDDLLVQLGYLGLFAISLLSATVVPLTSEPVLAGLQLLGYSPLGLLLVALCGSTLGSLSSYYLGRRGRSLLAGRLAQRHPHAESKYLPRAQALFARWGNPILFFSWLPLIGDAMVMLAGAAAVHPLRFTAWVAAGKAVRYVVVLALVGGAASLFQ